jgi:hypothetical protein
VCKVPDALSWFLPSGGVPVGVSRDGPWWTMSTVKTPPVAGCSETSPKARLNVESSSWANCSEGQVRVAKRGERLWFEAGTGSQCLDNRKANTLWNRCDVRLRVVL